MMLSWCCQYEMMLYDVVLVLVDCTAAQMGVGGVGRSCSLRSHSLSLALSGVTG